MKRKKLKKADLKLVNEALSCDDPVSLMRLKKFAKSGKAKRIIKNQAITLFRSEEYIASLL